MILFVKSTYQMKGVSLFIADPVNVDCDGLSDSPISFIFRLPKILRILQLNSQAYEVSECVFISLLVVSKICG
jgi:hypothetical protein